MALPPSLTTQKDVIEKTIFSYLCLLDALHWVYQVRVHRFTSLHVYTKSL